MFVWLLQNTILAGLLAIGVALLCRFRRIGPALRHALWLLVLVRLVLPPGALNWPWEVPLRWPAPETAAAETSIAQRPADASFVESVEIVQTSDGNVPEPPSPPLEPPVTSTATAAIAPWWIWAGRGALLLWLSGALGIAWRQGRGIAQLHFVTRAGLPASAKLLRWVSELAVKMNLRPPRVLVVPGLPSPLVGGLFRPVLLWPQQLEDRLSENGLKAVLVHELAHLRRRDHWVRWLEVLAECVWWWNPLFRLARARVRQYAELACDAWVLAVLPQARRAYADALVEVCARVSRGRQIVPALGIEGEGDFQRRLTMIMRESVACRLPRRTLGAIGALALLALPGFTLGQDQPKSNEPPNEKKEAPAVSKPGVGVIWADFDSDGKVEIVLQDELFDLIDRQPEDRD